MISVYLLLDFHDSPVTQKHGVGFCLQFEAVVSVDEL